MATIILIPGAFHGGWYFAPIMPALRAAGHDVHALSLSGLGGPSTRVWTMINLETHIEDVVSYIELEKLDDIVLCGHSYAGMVIAGAADRLLGRVKTLMFMDAMVPANGDSVWSTWGAPVRDVFIQNAADGLFTSPPPGVDPRARAHPLATFLQPVSLSDNAYAVKNRVYVWCKGDAGSPFEAIYNRVASEGGWGMHTLPCGHDFMNEAPELARDLILEVAALGE
jgi:pimeloyl-ACP methyl ester carboxylesterase